MNNIFETEEGKEVLSYLQDQLRAELVCVKEQVVHLKVGIFDSLAQKVMSRVEFVKQQYPRFFSTPDIHLLFEFPFGGRMRHVVYGQRYGELIRRFGGIHAGLFWFINDDKSSIYGYKGGDTPPDAATILNFIEIVLHY